MAGGGGRKSSGAAPVQGPPISRSNRAGPIQPRERRDRLELGGVGPAGGGVPGGGGGLRGDGGGGVPGRRDTAAEERLSVMPKSFYNMLDLNPLEECYLNVHLADSSKKKPLGRVDDVLIVVNDNYVPVDFIVMDIECNASCPIILRRPFLRSVGAIIDIKEGNIRFQFPLKKGMEHFPRKRKKLPFESIIRSSYALDVAKASEKT